MGCTDSSTLPPPRAQNTAPPQNYNNQNSMFYQMQNAKRPKFLNPQPLPQPLLETLWSVIQKNSLKQFAYILQNQQIPSNVEAGPSNTFWNFAHFCCRWDAFECLYYMIQRVYAQNRTLLMSMINQQSIEGYTPIHVAIQWNALSCFYMILDCGGADLSYTDKANNDVFAKAHLFKRQQMLEVLQKFKAGNALMVLVQSDKTYGFKTFSQMVATGQVQPRPSYRLTNQRIDYIIDSRNRLNRPPPPPPPKQNNQQQFQEHYNNMKKIQERKGQKSMGEGQTSFDMLQKQAEEQKRFQQAQDKIKRQKAEELKRNVQRQRQQQEMRIKSEIEKQQNKQIEFEKSQLQKIEKEKQIMRKNIQAMNTGPIQNKVSGSKKKMICPQDIKPIYEAALAKKTRFVDNQFPPQLSTIGDTSKFKFGWQSCVWLRPEQIFGGDYQVFDGISPDDVKQGTLGVCYYLSLLASIAQKQERIKKIFRFYDKQLGFYAIQLYVEGKPKTMIVDDLVPCMKGTNEPLFSKPRGKENWVMVLEKAWVKMFGDYLSAQSFACNHMFENVLPSPCSMVIIDISKIDEFFDKLIDFDKKNYIMTTSSSVNGNGDEVVDGIVPNHAYSLIGVYNLNGIKLAKIRNPWAKTQFSGMFSDQSTLWTPQLMKAVGFKKSEDGQFFLNPTELQRVMPIVTVSYYRDDYEYSHIQITSKSNQEIFHMITVKKRGDIAMKVTQQNQRFRKGMKFQNTRILFQIYKIGDNYNAQLISDGEPSTAYGGITTLYSHLDIYSNYEPGKYLIRLKIYYDRAHPISSRGTMRKFIRGTDGKNPLIVMEGTSVLSIYGPETYIFFKITTQQAYKYLKNAFKQQILTNPLTQERLSSVGQDLKPMVVSQCLKMKHQVIYYAVNNFPNNQITFNFRFDYQKFRNASYAYNVDKEKQVAQWVLGPNGGWNLCTLQVDFPVQEIATEGELKQDFKIVR